MRVLFLYLKAFSGIGGVEKFNRAFLKALYEISAENSIELSVLSLHDREPDNRYVEPQFFRGFGGKKTRFVIESVLEGLKSDLTILGHINLSPIGLAIKKLKRNAKIIPMAYGIDIWYELPKIKVEMLKNAYRVLSISDFTKKKLIETHNIERDRILIFPCAIDPYFKPPPTLGKPRHIMERYDLNEGTKVILTVSRLLSTEMYKGYDKVIQALPKIMECIPDIKYIIVGKGDRGEIERLKRLTNELGLENHVVLTGYVPNEELSDYYMVSDVFIMPSKREGFGIVFLEALACGKPVIAGNQDGSVDALLRGELGVLIDPDSTKDISEAIVGVLKNRTDANLVNPSYLANRVTEEFGFFKFKSRLEEIIAKLDG